MLGWHGKTESGTWWGGPSVLNGPTETFDQFTPFAAYENDAENDDDENNNR